MRKGLAFGGRCLIADEMGLGKTVQVRLASPSPLALVLLSFLHRLGTYTGCVNCHALWQVAVESWHAAAALMRFACC